MAGDDRQEGPIQNVTLGTTTYTNNTRTTFPPNRRPRSATTAERWTGDVAVPIRGAAPLSGHFLSGATFAPRLLERAPSSLIRAIRAASCPGPFRAPVGGALCSPAPSVRVTVAGSGTELSRRLRRSAGAARRTAGRAESSDDIPRGDPRLIVVAVTTPGRAVRHRAAIPATHSDRPASRRSTSPAGRSELQRPGSG